MSSAAVDLIEKGKYEKIVWIRNNIEVKNSKPIGHLPGDYKEKLLPFAMPLADHLGGVDSLEIMIGQGRIEIVHLGFIRGRDIKNSKDGFTNEYSFNIESVPAERAAVILCQKDNVLYDLKDKFIYSNQWIPLSAKCTIQEKLRLCSILDEKCSGGSIAHINLESNFPNTDMAWDMLNKIAQSGVIYFAFNTRINECKNHHGFIGTDHCPHCGEPVFDTYQRIVGYLVPSRAYSKDRFKEFNTRQWYTYAEAMSE